MGDITKKIEAIIEKYRLLVFLNATYAPTGAGASGIVIFKSLSFSDIEVKY